jgi:Astacin (Peptidase family M12A)
MFKQLRNLIPLLIVLFLVFLSACQQSPNPVQETPTLPGNLRETEIVLPGFDKPQKVIYEIVDGYAMFEGDIILGKVDAQGNLIKSDLQTQGIVKDNGRWSGGIIPFVINSNVTAAGVSNINSAIAHWTENSPITFVARTTQTNYVEFVRGTSAGACSSPVGRVGGRQEIKLTPNGDCSRGALIHEIGHAVGLWHEQSREDRNTHVTIMTANIESGREHNFNQQINNATDVGDYDFGSIMHYGAFAFCKTNTSGGCIGPTIVTIPAGVPIGQRTGLSQGDKAAVIELYPANTSKILWRHTTGKISLWTVNKLGNHLIDLQYGPFPGFTAVNYADGKILWRHTDGRISLWTVDSLGRHVSDIQHGPFSGFTGVNYADGKILWRHTTGKISLWTVDSIGNHVSDIQHGPFDGFTAINYAGGKILWRHTTGKISLWTVNSLGQHVSDIQHGPFSGFTALNYADSKILWRHTDGRISLWTVNSLGQHLSDIQHGPFTGFTGVNYADGKILWRHTTGKISLWTVDSLGNHLSDIQHGPFSGFRGINQSK